MFAKAAWLCVLATAALLVWGALGLFAPEGGQEKGNALIGEEMINKWKAYEDFSRTLQGSARRTISWNSGKVQQTHSVYKQNRDCVLICFADEEKSTERLYGKCHSP